MCAWLCDLVVIEYIKLLLWNIVLRNSDSLVLCMARKATTLNGLLWIFHFIWCPLHIPRDLNASVWSEEFCIPWTLQIQNMTPFAPRLWYIFDVIQAQNQQSHSFVAPNLPSTRQPSFAFLACLDSFLRVCNLILHFIHGKVFSGKSVDLHSESFVFVSTFCVLSIQGGKETAFLWCPRCWSPC